MIGILSVLGMLFLPAPLYSQFNATSLEADVSIFVIPANPKPGEAIVLELQSYTADITQASISWRYNGSVVASGVGKTRISSTAPKNGSPAVISASISGTDINTTTAITLNTASVDLLWEAVDAYTPPFYKGKALLPPNGWIRTTAIPTATAPKNLSYEWSRNDAVVQSMSGYNRTFSVFKNETIQQQERVAVTASSGGFTGSASATLPSRNPAVIVYKNNAGFIDYANGFFAGLTTTLPGITLRFEPYFFSVPTSVSKDLTIEIANNTTSIVDYTNPTEVTLAAPDTKGESILDVTIRTALYSLQHATPRFKILFQ